MEMEGYAHAPSLAALKASATREDVCMLSEMFWGSLVIERTRIQTKRARVDPLLSESYQVRIYGLRRCHADEKVGKRKIRSSEAMKCWSGAVVIEVKQEVRTIALGGVSSQLLAATSRHSLL